MSFLNVLILFMYDVSWGDCWNDLSISIGLTRYSPDSVWTQDRTKYSQFLNIAAKLLVGHDDTIIAYFDIPCNLCLVVASWLFAGICFILHWKVTFFDMFLILLAGVSPACPS
jgi:hypothetical protein